MAVSPEAVGHIDHEQRHVRRLGDPAWGDVHDVFQAQYCLASRNSTRFGTANHSSPRVARTQGPSYCCTGGHRRGLDRHCRMGGGRVMSGEGLGKDRLGNGGRAFLERLLHRAEIIKPLTV